MNTMKIFPSSALIVSSAFLVLVLLAVAAVEIRDQLALKRACELRVPRDTVCIVAYHPVEIVEWSEGVERKEP